MKALPAAFAALFLVVGCVSVGPSETTAPTTAATAAPSLGVTTPAPATETPTVAPTATPAPTPTPTPTPAPTAAPTEEATVVPESVAPSVVPPSSGPSSSDELFADDFSDPSSGWEELDQDFASVTYDSGVLAFRYNDSGAWAFTVRSLDVPESTLVLAADFSPQSDGVFGLLCGDSNSAKFYGAVVGSDGGLVFLETDNGTINVLQRYDEMGLDVSIGGSNPLALECSATPDGVVQMVVGLSKTGPVAVHRESSTGITSFDTTGMYGEASSDGYTLTVDTVAAWGVGGADATMSDGAQMVLAHIPSELQQNCYESPIWNTDAQFVVTCIEQTEGTGAELAQYKQYADADGMNSDYQGTVSAFGVTSTGSCQSGPNEAGWTLNEQPGGRVQCAPQTVGIRFDWTDDQSGILSTLIDFDGSYQDTYNQWQDAGPINPQ